MVQLLNASTCYSTFREIIRLIHACARVEDIAELLVQKISQAFDAPGAFVQLYDRGTGSLALNLVYGLGEAGWKPRPVAELESIVELGKQNRILTIDDTLADPLFSLPEELRRQHLEMLLLAPLGLREDLAGVFCLAFARRQDFSAEEIDFLAAVTEQCTLAMDKARLIDKQKLQFDRLAYQTERLTALGRMAAGVAHDLNNPLSSILLYSSNMKKKVPPDGFLQEGLEIIIQETKRCKTIIQELQEFSRSKEPKKTVSNINHILQKVIHLLNSEFRRQHIRLQQDLAENLPDMLVDIGQMQQVFASLLLNAVEAVGNKGEITINTCFDSKRQFIDIDIADSGGGIPPEYLPRVFEPFFSTKPKGTGLGLAVTYGFVMNHQGDIQVSSEPGKGTRFLIRLPVSLGANPQPQA